MAELYDFGCELIHETEKAWLVNDGMKQFWVPKSISDFDPLGKVMTVPQWFAEKEELV